MTIEVIRVLRYTYLTAEDYLLDRPNWGVPAHGAISANAGCTIESAILSERVDAVTFVENQQAPLPLDYSLKDAANVLGIGLTKLSELIADNEIESVTVGRRRLISQDAIVAYREKRSEAAKGRV